MAKSIDKSRTLGKIKGKIAAVWKKSSKVKASPKGARLPGNIVGGIAKVIEAGVGESEKGVPYAKIVYMVCEPAEQRGIKQINMHFIQASQYKTIEEIVANLVQELQMCGMDTDGVDLDDVLTSLDNDKPHVKFNTSSGNFNGKDWFKFHTQCVVDYDDTMPNDEVEEDDVEEVVPVPKKRTNPKPKQPEPEIEEEQEETEESEDDTEETEESEDDTEETEDSDDDSDSDNDTIPSVGEQWGYRGETGKGRLMVVEVVKVNEATGTVDIKDDKGKTHKGVDWSLLEGD